MYASGTALARDARELAESSTIAAHRLMVLAGGVAANLSGPLVTEAAREGDPAAVEIYPAMGRWLGRGVASLARMDQYSFRTKVSISRSRSQTRRSATDWTRPADRAPGSLRHSTGDRVKPTR